ncbi:MAG: AMP-binding protein, partial [Promethearchaeota archaeon]
RPNQSSYNFIIIGQGMGDMRDYEQLISMYPPHEPRVTLDEDELACLMYTSGTTGRPRGIFYSHRDVFLQALMYAANASISINDCVFQIVPMFHVLGWGTPFAATLVGAEIVFPGQYSLKDLNRLINTIVLEQVTVVNGATAILMPMLESIRKMDKKPDLSGTRFITGASEPPKAMMKDFWELTGAEVIHTYGSTEAHALVTLNRLIPIRKQDFSDEEMWEFKRKQGYIVSGLDVKIVDPLSGKELAHDGTSSGEILLKGPWIAGRYYNIQSEDHFTNEGYFKTGDIGNLDPDGYLKITDRIKDVIKSGGEWISSVDMENAIVSHPQVVEAAVVGCPHPKWEERPLALVIQREDSDTKKISKEIYEQLEKKFAKWQLPDKILFVDKILKTSVGKIDKKNIREKYKNIYKPDNLI